MDMKKTTKILSLLLAALMLASAVLVFSSCSKSDGGDSTQPVSDSAAADSGSEKGSKNAKYDIVSANFVEKIIGYDHENPGSYFGGAEGHYGVDIVLSVSDAGDAGISEENATGSLTYDGREHELQYVREWGKSGFMTQDEYKNMPAHDSGLIHLFVAALPEGAEKSTDLKAEFTVGGKKGSVKIAPPVSEDPLAAKKELKVGDKFTNVYKDLDIEVFRCTKGELLTSEPDKSAKYVGESFDVVLKITNKGTTEITDADISHYIEGYVSYKGRDGEFLSAGEKFENDEHTELVFEKTIAPGQTAFYHLITRAEDTADDIFRINFGFNSYIIKPAG